MAKLRDYECVELTDEKLMKRFCKESDIKPNFFKNTKAILVPITCYWFKKFLKVITFDELFVTEGVKFYKKGENLQVASLDYLITITNEKLLLRFFRMTGNHIFLRFADRTLEYIEDSYVDKEIKSIMSLDDLLKEDGVTIAPRVTKATNNQYIVIEEPNQ